MARLEDLNRGASVKGLLPIASLLSLISSGTRFRTVISVHGCFWHRHTNCTNSVVPKKRRDSWVAKLDSNVSRDRRNSAALKALGWSVRVVRECELQNPAKLSRKITKWFGSTGEMGEHREKKTRSGDFTLTYCCSPRNRQAGCAEAARGHLPISRIDPESLTAYPGRVLDGHNGASGAPGVMP